MVAMATITITGTVSNPVAGAGRYVDRTRGDVNRPGLHIDRAGSDNHRRGPGIDRAGTRRIPSCIIGVRAGGQ